MIKDATVLPSPDPSWRAPVLLCPECNEQLPIDEYTKCSHCGAHLRLCVDIVARGHDSVLEEDD